MILQDNEIIKKIKNKEITITPEPRPEQIQPASIDLTLGDEFYTIIKNEKALDIKNEEPKYNHIKANAIIIPPGEFLLGTTIEWIEIPPGLCAKVEGRSSLGRLGIMVHVTAGFIDPGFKGNITLEIKNVSQNSIILYEGMRICQVLFEELKNIPDNVYGDCGNKYQNQNGVTGSLIYWDEDNVKL